ncbi:MAG: type II secretion system protein GspL [Usitatibacter sp.]
MKLRIFLPPVDRPDPSTRFAWKLFDARDSVLREGVSSAAEMPHGDDVEAVLPAERVLFARLKLPKVNAATIRELLPYAVEDRLLDDPSHIHAVAGATNARGETVVTVIDRNWLRAMLDALALEGLRPARAWCESALLAGGRGDWHVVLGAERGMLVDDDGVSATFDRSPGFPLAVRLALDEASARGERPALVRVHHDDEVPLPDLARWSADAGVPFAPGARWQMLASGQPHLPPINLMQGEFSARGPGPRIRIPRAAVLLAGLIVAAQVIFAAVDNLKLRREYGDLERRREAIFRDAFPDAKVVVDPQLQMARNLAELKRSRGLAAGDDFLVQMTQLARGVNGPVRAVEYADGRIAAK